MIQLTGCKFENSCPICFRGSCKKAPRSWERRRPRLPASSATDSVNACWLDGTRAGEDACAPRTAGPFARDYLACRDATKRTQVIKDADHFWGLVGCVTTRQTHIGHFSRLENDQLGKRAGVT